MYEFFVVVETSNLVKFLLDKVFHCLDVVVGGLLDGLHPLSVGLTEVAIDVSKCFKQAVVESLQLWQRQFAERNEILNLHSHSILYECIL